MASDSSTVAAGSPQVDLITTDPQIFTAARERFRGCFKLATGQTAWTWLPAGQYVVGKLVEIVGPSYGVATPFTARELTPVGKSEMWLVSDEWLKRMGYDFDAKTAGGAV